MLSQSEQTKALADILGSDLDAPEESETVSAPEVASDTTPPVTAPALSIVSQLQTELQNARMGLELQKLGQQLLKAQALPNPNEVHDMRKLIAGQTEEIKRLNSIIETQNTQLDDQRLDINGLKTRVNNAESNGWKGKHDRLQRELDLAKDELARLRQPDLDTAAQINRLNWELDVARAALATQAAANEPSFDEPVIRVKTVIQVGLNKPEVLSRADAEIAQARAQGWRKQYEDFDLAISVRVIRWEYDEPLPAAPHSPAAAAAVTDKMWNKALEEAVAAAPAPVTPRRVVAGDAFIMPGGESQPVTVDETDGDDD
jgi:hypothetical protein